MKKIINKPESVVDEMCRGLVMAYGGLDLLAKYRVITRRTGKRDKVALISGGGSGHEPAHAGFVGEGMLDAAVCGDVFASPSQVQIYNAIKAVNNPAGTLLVIKNYSGDVMNFQNAAFLAELDGIKIASVKVSDDIAVQDSLYTVGRRGVAGTVFVHKIAGAAAEAGNDLSEVQRIAQKTADMVGSVGFAYSSCTVPAKGSPTFTLGNDGMEYGVGIHGEPGIRRERIVTADELAERMTRSILDDWGISAKSEVAVLINGFGSTPLQESYILKQSVLRVLREAGITVFRVWVGNFMTSIDMTGASVSILGLDEELRRYLAMPCDTPALKIRGNEDPVRFIPPPAQDARDEAPSSHASGSGKNIVNGDTIDLETMIFILETMSETIIRNEVKFCEMDSHAGDGDFGMSVAKGFKQLRREWKDIIQSHTRDIGDLLDSCSMVIMEHCGGASGPIWGFAFKYAAKATSGKRILAVRDFADMMQAAVTGVQTVGEWAFGRGAVVGDKTLIDALVPCADSWRASADAGDDMITAFKKGALAAVDGARATDSFVARLGRAGTVGERSIGHPDAGAFALGVIFTEIADSLVAGQ